MPRRYAPDEKQSLQRREVGHRVRHVGAVARHASGDRSFALSNTAMNLPKPAIASGAH